MVSIIFSQHNKSYKIHCGLTSQMRIYFSVLNIQCKIARKSFHFTLWLALKSNFNKNAYTNYGQWSHIYIHIWKFLWSPQNNVNINWCFFRSTLRKHKKKIAHKPINTYIEQQQQRILLLCKRNYLRFFPNASVSLLFG